MTATNLGSLSARPAGLRPVSELRALAERGARELENATAEEIVRWVADNFAVERTAVACSMADAVLPHVVASALPGVDVLFLDTGYHFIETYVTRDEVERALDVRVVDVKPKQTVAEQDAEFGAELFARDPNLCCARRKVEPLQRALTGYELWFTGVRREEAPTRTATPFVSWDEKNGLVKVNPLAAWTFDELVEYATANAVPLNLLLTAGYPSIGCEPCTKPVAEGEDPRSGRWAGLAKTECGLHE
ncbi:MULTISPECIES: phosphoadenylyl-sulfate reductase [unclassified Leifsonia]|jgi:phosphoadenosine phosphosulfate reductase|uniref:phosphoadenylyl-sulfate reductase n=1 Tax=unclassified Leifsonia TaxID=2663824 RepID=UPI0008A8125D|nr:MULTISPECIES: phosphoadenylyl-sulfate reductase [unclassified Leifsonia]SEH55651.1 phosphoadenylylsulfate reductase (thioredoxin) [Leifsonia sp. CL154]SFL23407.1 phosphoadenylylsulfate reductase (thioredoxin) [Leifsonia sp. CL147]